MGARRCEGTGRGESPDAKEETTGTPAEEKRRLISSSNLTTTRRHFRFDLAELSERDEGRPDGDFSPMFVGWA